MGFADIGLSINKRIAIFWGKDKATAGCLCFITICIRTEIKHKADNPKRRQRNAHKQLEKTGVGTKSQQVLQKQYEESKLEHKQRSREQKEAEKQRQFELKQQKRKEKHRGH